MIKKAVLKKLFELSPIEKSKLKNINSSTIFRLMFGLKTIKIG